MPQRNFSTMITRALISTIFIVAGCAKNDSDGGAAPSPVAEKKVEDPKNPQKKDETKQAELQRARAEADSRKMATSSPKDIARVVDPHDNTTILFARLMTAAHANEVEAARNRLVDEVFSDEGQAPLKIVVIQASVSKLAQSGLYGDAQRDRVKLLRTKLEQRTEENQQSDVLEKGVIFAATGFLALGPLAASGVYRKVPEVPGRIRQGFTNTRTAWRENVSERLGPKWREIKDKTVTAGRQVKESVSDAAARTFRPTDRVLRDNLEDLKVSTMNPEGIHDLRAIEPSELPQGLIYTDTPKGSLRYAVVDNWPGEELGATRRIVFNQSRLIRNNPLETTFVTNPMPEDVARNLGESLARREATPPEQQFVEVIHPETGAVASTRMTWGRFKEMMASTGQGYREMFLSPTSLGVGATTTAAGALAYWWGFDRGHNYGQASNAMDLEAMIIPQNSRPVVQSSLPTK